MAEKYAEATVELVPDPNADSYHLNVFVIDTEDGTAVNNAQVAIAGRQSAFEATATTSSGVVQFDDIRADTYDVEVTHERYQDNSTSVPESGFEAE